MNNCDNEIDEEKSNDERDIQITRMRKAARISIVLGFISLFTNFFSLLWGPTFFILGSIVAFFTSVIGLFNGIKAISLMLQYKCKVNISESIAGIILAFFALSCLVLMFTAPYFRKPHQGDYKFHCITNLKQIGLALKNYAIDYDGYFPPYDDAAGLELLRKNEYLYYYKSYICPDSKLKISPPGKPLTEENISYAYRGGLKDSPENANIPVAWDKDSNHKGYGNILYPDGRVESVKGADWKATLKSDKKTGNK